MDGISIVLATYNGDRFLEALLDSLLKQTLPFDEIIVIDDASSDTTIEILKRLKDDRFKIHINSENQGVLRSFERGLELVNYDLICLCDQDDIWRANKLATLKNGIGPFSLIYSDVIIKSDFSAINKSSFKDVNPLFGLDSGSKLFLECLCFHSFILGCSVMFKREILCQALPLATSSRNHDWWISINSALSGGVKYIPEPLVIYRVHDQNVSIGRQSLQSLILRSFRVSKPLDYVLAVQKAIDFFDANDQAISLVEDFKDNVRDGSLLKRILFTMRWSDIIHPKTSIVKRIFFSVLRPLRYVNFDQGKR